MGLAAVCSLTINRRGFFCFCFVQLNIVEGKMQYLFDERGRRYLDAFAGIATVCCGHCHPDVVGAIAAQAGRLQHSTVLYLNHAIADFAEALASKMPGDLKVYCRGRHLPVADSCDACSDRIDGARARERCV